LQNCVGANAPLMKCNLRGNTSVSTCAPRVPCVPVES
jgi:hypothetical protein